MKTTVFFIICVSVFLRMRNFSDESFRGNQNTHFVFNNFFFRKSCLFLDNLEKYCTAGQTTDDNTTHAHCKPDTTDSHTEYVIIIIIAFPLQQWL